MSVSLESPVAKLHLRLANVLPELRAIAAEADRLGYSAFAAEWFQAVEIGLKQMHALASRSRHITDAGRGEYLDAVASNGSCGKITKPVRDGG